MDKCVCERFDHQGRGICYINGLVTFVPFFLPKEVGEIEIIESKKNYNVGKLINLACKSNLRRTPRCPYYGTCGGCQLQHLEYASSIKFKKEKLENLFSKAHIEIPSIEMIENESPYFYRNKVSLKVKEGRLGYYESKSHTFLEIRECPIANPVINAVIHDFSMYAIDEGEITIRTNSNGEILLIFKTEESLKIKEEFPLKHKVAGIILNGKCVYGVPYFYERVSGFLFRVSYDAFFQVNPFVLKHLFSILEANLSSTDVIYDLYSGVGTLSCVSAKKARKVYSIEIIPNAIFDGIKNAKLNQLSNISFHVGKVESILKNITDKSDCFIVDPPRSGLDKMTKKIIKERRAKTIIYISCNPHTLIRDILNLSEYKVEKIYGLDFFSETQHIETIVRLSYQKKN